MGTTSIHHTQQFFLTLQGSPRSNELHHSLLEPVFLLSPRLGSSAAGTGPGFAHHSRVPSTQHQPGHLPGAHPGTPEEPFLPSLCVGVQCVFSTKGQGHTPPAPADWETRSRWSRSSQGGSPKENCLVSGPAGLGCTQGAPLCSLDGMLPDPWIA